MTQTELAPDDYDQDNQDASQSVISSGSVEDDKEKFKKMIHKILGVNDSKQIDKICCFFKINKQWSRSRQLFCTYSLFLTFFMVIILGYFVFYLKFCPNYVGDTILDQIDSSISANFQNSLSEYSKQVHQYFKSYSTWQIAFSQIFSNHVGWSTSLFQQQSEMNIKAQQLYFRVNSPVPANIINKQYSQQKPYQGKDITFQTFSYMTFLAEDAVSLSAATQTVLNSVDIISYYFPSFILDPNITYIQSLYVYLEEREVLCFFPGGLIDVPAGVNVSPITRPWYQDTTTAFKKNNFVPTFTITGPYLDLISKQQTLTYSLPIVKQSNPQIIAGIINIDIIVNNFKSVYDLLQDKNSEFQIALIDYNTQYIINDVFNSSSIIYFYNQTITHFTLADWNIIQDFTTYPQNQTFILANDQNIRYYFARSLINDTVYVNQYRFMLVVFGKESNYLSYRSDTQSRINTQLYNYCISLVIALAILWFVSYFFIFVFAQKTVSPLAKLSQLAKSINKNEERKSSAEDLKEQLSKIQGADVDTKKLIEAFINLVDQHSGMRKLAQNAGYQDNIIPVYNKMNNVNENYSRNDYREEFDDIKEQIRYLKNFDQEEDDDDDNGSNQDVDEVYPGNPKCKSSSSMHSNRYQNEDDLTEADNKYYKRIKEQQREAGLAGNNASANNSFASNIYVHKKDKYYFKWLKEQLYIRQDNEVAKIGLSLFVLNQLLPKNTQSI